MHTSMKQGNTAKIRINRCFTSIFHFCRLAFFLPAILMTIGYTMTLHAQTKQLTLNDLIPGGSSYQRFVPKNLKQIQWMGEKYIFQQGDTLWISAPANPEKKSILLSIGALNELLTKNGIKNTSRIPTVKAGSEGNNPYIEFKQDSLLINLNPVSKKINYTFPLSKGDQNTDKSPDNSHLAATNQNGLYLIARDGLRTTVATSDSTSLSFGANNVHRNEFGIYKGTFWSPQGEHLAFYRMDENRVKGYPMVDISAYPATLDMIKYPMAGQKSHEVSIGIYSLKNRKTIYLETGKPKDRYLTNIAWSPAGDIIYIAELNRGQDTCKLESYSALTGKHLKTLFTETHQKYVEPEHPVLFLKNRSDQFIWQSKRDGYNHLYLYDTDGNLIKQLTSGHWNVTDIPGFDKTGDNLFYQSSSLSPLDRNYSCLDIKTGFSQLLTPAPGIHQAKFNESGKFMIDSYSNSTTPRVIELITIGKNPAKNLLTAKNPYDNCTFPTISTGTLTAADDSTQLYYRLVTPSDLDTTKKYPAIIYVYGGPHAQMINNSWLSGTRGWDIYMAERGYIILTVDNRGSAGRSLEFENTIHRQLGIEEMKDQLRGVDLLQGLPFVDKDRIGVHGWSYGGFMTTNLMLSYPDIFKVGVAGGPVIDWKYYEIMYGERYMDSPQENPIGYDESNLNKKAANLSGHLLLIHGDNDPVVVWQHSLSFLKSCIDAGTYPDYFVYPGHEHNVKGKDRIHLHEKITRYFDQNLK